MGSKSISGPGTWQKKGNETKGGESARRVEEREEEVVGAHVTEHINLVSLLERLSSVVEVVREEETEPDRLRAAGEKKVSDA